MCDWVVILKLPILISQMLALHRNGVEFRQKFNGALRIPPAMSYHSLERHYSSIACQGFAF